jgi:hypothetical protein
VAERTGGARSVVGAVRSLVELLGDGISDDVALLAMTATGDGLG